LSPFLSPEAGFTVCLRIQVKLQGKRKKAQNGYFPEFANFLNDFFRGTSFCQTP
jgi:hypothetical protein